MTLRQRLARMLLAAIAASACSVGGVGSSTSPAGQLEVPHPVKVTPVLDSGHGVVAEIPVTGGTLTATGADGSVFTLTIPDKALGAGVKITMTPISAIPDLPFHGGLIAGVQLEPDGLLLFRMATLVIKPAREVPIDRQVGLSHHGKGSDLHLSHLDPVAGLSFHILHFSGDEVADGTKAEVATQASRAPSDPTDQAAQRITARIQAILGAERQAQLTGNPANPHVFEGFKPDVQQYYDQVVRPRMAAAKGNYKLVPRAIATAHFWMRQVQLLGLAGEDDPRMVKLMAEIIELVKLVQKELTDRCLNKHDISAAQALLALERELQLLGEPEGKGLETVKKCLRFELSFETVSPFLASGGQVMASGTLHARVRLILVPEPLQTDDLTVSKPLEVVDTDVCPCADNARKQQVHFVNVVNSRPFAVRHFGFETNFFLDEADRPKCTGIPCKDNSALYDIRILIDPGEVTADVTRYAGEFYGDVHDTDGFTMIDCGSPGYSAEVSLCWANRHHFEAVAPNVYGIMLEPNPNQGQSLLARKTYELPCTFGPLGPCGVEKTIFELRHAPAG